MEQVLIAIASGYICYRIVRWLLAGKRANRVGTIKQVISIRLMAIMVTELGLERGAEKTVLVYLQTKENMLLGGKPLNPAELQAVREILAKPVDPKLKMILTQLLHNSVLPAVMEGLRQQLK